MPSSYQAPSRKDKMSATTHSQSSESNLKHDTATVRKLLQSKGAEVFGLRPQNTLHEAVEMLRDKRVGALRKMNAPDCRPAGSIRRSE
jgi:hypothetical protein